MVKKIKINLSGLSGYVDGEEDRIITKKLKWHSLFSEHFLYSVFNGNRVRQLEETGDYRNPEEGNNSIYAFMADELIWDAHPDPNCIRVHANKYINPALAIYNGKHFHKEYGDGLYEYRFRFPDKKRDALIAIAFLKLAD